LIQSGKRTRPDCHLDRTFLTYVRDCKQSQHKVRSIDCFLFGMVYWIFRIKIGGDNDGRASFLNFVKPWPLERIWNWPSFITFSVFFSGWAFYFQFNTTVTTAAGLRNKSESWNNSPSLDDMWKYLCYYSDPVYSDESSPLLQRTHNLDQSQRPIKSSPKQPAYKTYDELRTVLFCWTHWSISLRRTTSIQCPRWWMEGILDRTSGTPLISNDGDDGSRILNIYNDTIRVRG